ncbi:MAG: hypothetical protein AAB489_00620 [Patescibacteria group bacterium]
MSAPEAGSAQSAANVASTTKSELGDSADALHILFALAQAVAEQSQEETVNTPDSVLKYRKLAKVLRTIGATSGYLADRIEELLFEIPPDTSEPIGDAPGPLFPDASKE